MNVRNRFAFLIALLIGIGIGASVAGRGGLLVGAQTDTATMSAADVVAKVGPAVVTVINEQKFQNGNGSLLQPVGSGTGFIIDNDGHIVTNWHVVDGGQQFQVILQGGETRDADLVGSDPISDLAVVQIKGDLPATVSFGDSDQLRPGETVLAIGSPLGAFTNTVTEGIVSAIGRDFPYQTGGPQNYTNLIQHDAAINPGNSGGPLFNLAGQVVGVNTLGIPTDEQGQPVQGLFFAIPSTTVKTITGKLIADGKVVYPYFGIEFANVTPDVVAQLDLKVDHGVYVQNVPAGPAAEAGVQQGDVITAIDDTPIDQNTSFAEALFQHAPGDTVTAHIQRGNNEITLDVTLAKRDDNSG